MKTVILAGGRGTRIAALHRDIPKPMIPLAGVPVLERQVRALVAAGFPDIILVIGHLSEQIKVHFGSGAPFGAAISYIEETEPLGTAGALSLLRDALADDDFLLLCGDLLFDVDLHRFLQYHRKRGGISTIFTHPSNHPWDSVTVRAEETGRVTAFLPPEGQPGDRPNRTNAGIHFFSPRLFETLDLSAVKRRDLDRDILRPLAAAGQLYCYDSPEYVRDMGTPERLAEAETDLKSGLPAARNLSHPQRAVFLDRDGTLNKHIGFLRHPDEVELLPGAAEAVAAINQSGALAVLVTNQPVLARGEVTPAGLAAIHDRLVTLLGNAGAYLDAIYVCPHHPDKGFPGEVSALKTPCHCRKPAPGMLLAAAERYHIDLAASYMIGDSESDMQAGRAAGCKTVGIRPVSGDMTGDCLADCVQKLLEREAEQ